MGDEHTETTICDGIIAYDDGSYVIIEPFGRKKLCPNRANLLATIAKMASLMAPRFNCKCRELDAGEGSLWLAVYGMVARDLKVAWEEGKRTFHHPDCQALWR
jgi:hypothetical protein